jgi:cytoskeletal protein CcmA (bactofilin family)
LDGESAAAPPEVAENATTYIDAGAEMVGKLKFKDTVRIDGRVEGEIHSTNNVIVGEGATVAANIEADSVVVHGTVEGDIIVKRKITLHKNARVTGEIQTSGIVVEEGARFRGRILIGDDEPESKTATLPKLDEKPAAKATPAA